jgi:hypothetical protein
LRPSMVKSIGTTWAINSWTSSWYKKPGKKI